MKISRELDGISKRKFYRPLKTWSEILEFQFEICLINTWNIKNLLSDSGKKKIDVYSRLIIEIVAFLRHPVDVLP